ncbi:adhesion G protein-coupled receptor L2-like [Saccoglossus kowalevskii]
MSPQEGGVQCKQDGFFSAPIHKLDGDNVDEKRKRGTRGTGRKKVFPPTQPPFDPVAEVENKVQNLFEVISKLMEPQSLKTEEDKLIVARAVEEHITTLFVDNTGDAHIQSHYGYSTVDITVIQVFNQSQLYAEFGDYYPVSPAAATTAVPGELTTATTLEDTMTTDAPLLNTIAVPESVIESIIGSKVIFSVIYYVKEAFLENTTTYVVSQKACQIVSTFHMGRRRLHKIISAAQGRTGARRINNSFYRFHVDEKPQNEHTTLVMNSGVLSCQLWIDGVHRSIPVEFLLQHQQSLIPRSDEMFSTESTRTTVIETTLTKQQPLCSFYDYDARVWEQFGCSVDYDASNNDHTKCQCNHTTNFAVLMQIKEFTISETHVKALEIITMVGCSISLFALVGTAIMFIWLDTLKYDHNIIHFNLIIALIIAQTVFLSGVSATSNKVACMVVAILLHTSFLAVFMWMLMEGVHLYSKVVIVFGTESSKVKFYLLFGWGIPAVIVAISVAINPEGYGTRTGCWLDMGSGLIWAFVGPALAVLMINIIILMVVMRIVIVSAKTASEKKEHTYIRTAVRSALFLLPILGITWVFGLFAVNEHAIVFQYLFAVFNSLQGLFVFLFQGMFNSEIRHSFKRKMEKRALQKGEIITTSGAVNTRTYERSSSGYTARTRTTSAASSSGDSTPYKRCTPSAISNGDVVIEEETDLYHISVPVSKDTNTISKQVAKSESTSTVGLPGATDEGQVLYDI